MATCSTIWPPFSVVKETESLYAFKGQSMRDTTHETELIRFSGKLKPYTAQRPSVLQEVGLLLHVSSHRLLAHDQFLFLLRYINLRVASEI